MNGANRNETRERTRPPALLLLCRSDGLGAAADDRLRLATQACISGTKIWIYLLSAAAALVALTSAVLAYRSWHAYSGKEGMLIDTEADRQPPGICGGIRGAAQHRLFAVDLDDRRGDDLLESLPDHQPAAAVKELSLPRTGGRGVEKRRRNCSSLLCAAFTHEQREEPTFILLPSPVRGGRAGDRAFTSNQWQRTVSHRGKFLKKENIRA